MTSTAVKAVQEAPIADKTTINIGQTMNQLNEQDNLKQLNLTPVQGNQVEEMDTQEGMQLKLLLFKDFGKVLYIVFEEWFMIIELSAAFLESTAAHIFNVYFQLYS